ncbi:PLD nuclease N-terminal domain-containing protein [Enterococcus asini]|uniref:PLD nuclease N-terminal domain-containing protein n=1 Tax=Enterococcus asini TaxID=57732 RepID=UPI00288D1CEE|nr:PLD nuclease N-terminal domain-containing protein [Enterococcus asini]MDT2756257.1 PLD nuclease N-terminal domain-containing protein [Enterococcus asini]
MMTSLTSTTIPLQEYLPVLIPLIILQFGLAIFAIVDVWRHPHYKRGNKLVWTLVSALFSFIGPILYFAIGKGEEE